MKSQNGFTLIELVITLAIVMVTLTIGVPSYQSVIENNRLALSTNSFIAALMLTRSEAIKRNTRVTLCKTIDRISCVADSTTDYEIGYEKGWIIFAETDNTGSCSAGVIDTDSTCHEPVIRVFEGFPENVTITATGTNADDFKDYVSYMPTGGVDKNGITGQFTITTGNKNKTVSISSTGRVQ